MLVKKTPSGYQFKWSAKGQRLEGSKILMQCVSTHMEKHKMDSLRELPTKDHKMIGQDYCKIVKIHHPDIPIDPEADWKRPAQQIAWLTTEQDLNKVKDNHRGQVIIRTQNLEHLKYIRGSL